MQASPQTSASLPAHTPVLAETTSGREAHGRTHTTVLPAATPADAAGRPGPPGRGAVVLLSARAGEQARVAEMAAGADDYVMKPFGARELVARVDGAVRPARVRREAARRHQPDFESLFSLAPDALIVVAPDGIVLRSNARAHELFGYSPQEFAGLQVEALLPEDRRTAHRAHRESYVGAPITRPMSPK